MSGVNKVILIGNLGADPEVRYFPSGDGVANLSVATSETWKDRNSGEPQERTEWHRVVIRGKLAEVVKNYLHKGSKVYLEGKLHTRKWQDQSGQDRYSTEIKAQRVQFLDRRNAGGEGAPAPAGGSDGGYRRAPQQNRQPARQQQSDYEDLGPAFPSEASGMDDVPF